MKTYKPINSKYITTDSIVYKTQEEEKYYLSDFLDTIYNVGSIVITNSNVNPSNSRYPGTWELVGKEYKSTRYRDDTAVTSINATAESFFIVRSGHTIRFRITWTTNVNLYDSAVELFQINLQKIGISDLYMQILHGLMGSDGGNSLIMYNLHYGTGTVSSIEVISKDGTGTCPAGSMGHLNVVVPVDFEFMIDSFCDKFYWRRTS